MSSLSDAYVLDLSAPEVLRDPYRTYARLRANRGVHYRLPGSQHSFAVLSRYADVRMALSDARFGRTPVNPHSWVAWQDDVLPQTTLEAFRAQIAAAAANLLEPIRRRGSFDLMADFAAPLSTFVATEVTCLQGVEGGQPTNSALAADVICNAMLALLTFRDQLGALRRTPAMISSGIEELLRFDAPMQRTSREALDEIELPEGDVIREGELVAILVGAANRDYEQFVEPDQLMLHRPNANRHLAFGGAGQSFQGASLARAEAQVAIVALVCGLPSLHLDEMRPTWHTTALRRLKSLPVAL
jgi:cytochrome P450